jgi:hypothetical protein
MDRTRTGFKRHLHFSRFHLGQIQDFVDQVQQVFARRMNGLGKFGLLGGQVLFLVFQKQPGEQQYAVKRRSELMGHVGHELRFVAAGDLKLPGFFFQFPVGFFQLGVLFFMSNFCVSKMAMWASRSAAFFTICALAASNSSCLS